MNDTRNTQKLHQKNWTHGSGGGGGGFGGGGGGATVGHVPQFGLFDATRELLAENRDGSEGICVTHHDDMSWLNAEASENMRSISVTWLVFQLPIGWLKEEASLNIPHILVTWLVSQLPMGWLNEEA